MFKPLGMVIAVIMGVTFLGDTLYLGRNVFLCIFLFLVFKVKTERTENQEGDWRGSFHYRWKRGERRERDETATRTLSGCSSICRAQKFTLLLSFLTFQREEWGIVERMSMIVGAIHQS
jgi:hypothetical protein